MQRIAGFPQQPHDRQTVTLIDVVGEAGTVYQFTLTYRSRTASWYLDLDTQDGTPVFQGRRLSPGWMANLAQLDGGPAGALVCLGSDTFVRGDLGGSNLRLVYVTPAEIAAAGTTPDDGIAFVTVS